MLRRHALGIYARENTAYTNNWFCVGGGHGDDP